MVIAALWIAQGGVVVGAWWATAVDALSFVVSDFLIGVTEIRGVRIPNANDWIWATYIAGQMGIVYAGWLVAPGA